jgi:hypothetical protein
LFDALPEAFGSHRVLEAIGSGRFGPVYRARHDATGLEVVIKVFDQELTPEQAARLAASFEKLGQFPLNHPSIVPILSAGTAGELVWVAEPWFDAVPLDSIMQRDGALPVAEVLVRVTHAAAALDFAAAVGIHHGALHPRDILVSGEQTLVAGLGVLQALNDAGLDVPMEGAYVSAQRARGLEVSAADDIFSLAAVAFELVQGSPVPARGDLRSAPPPAGFDAARFTDVLERALSAEAGDRPSSALAFAAALQETVVPHHAPAPAAAPSPRVAAVKKPAPVPVADFDSEAVDRPTEPAPPVNSDHGLSIRYSEPAAVADLPLRAADPESPPRAARGHAELSTTDADAPPRRQGSASEYGSWFAISATLAIGLLMGFAGGYVAGQREATPNPYAAERPVARNGPAGADGDSRGESATATGGRDFSESVVAPPSGTERRDRNGTGPAQGQSVRPPAASSDRPSDSPRAGEGSSEAERPNPSAPGVLQVDSRPRGARVFLDGRLVGTTPLVVDEVRPGAHAVRIDLIGHRRWVTTVDVAPGQRQKVAASLER